MLSNLLSNLFKSGALQDNSLLGRALEVKSVKSYVKFDIKVMTEQFSKQSKLQ